MARKTTQAIKSRQNKLSRRLKKLPDIGQSISLIIFGLLMGTVFIFLMQHLQGSVTIDEARPVSAVMEDVRSGYGGRHHRSLNGILIRFADHEQLSIDSPVATKAMLAQLNTYSAGTTFDMLVHPNSSTILALNIKGTEIFSFDDTVVKLAAENTGFFYLGLFMYICAAYGAAAMIIRLRLRRY